LPVTSVACSTVAVLSTVYRLIIRRERLWWDDVCFAYRSVKAINMFSKAWAFISMVALFIQISSVFMHVPHSSKRSMPSYYLMATSFYAIIWSARLSILFSIIRLDQNPKRKKTLLYISSIYILVAVLLLAQLFWVCEPEQSHNHWKDFDTPQCTLNKQVAICQLISDIIADLTLLIAPIKLFSEMGDKRLQIRLLIIFSTCIVTTIISLVHATYILMQGGPKVLIAAVVEARDCMSLFVCNVPVVATALLRLRENVFLTGPAPQSTKLSTRLFFRPETECVVDTSTLSISQNVSNDSSAQTSLETSGTTGDFG
ncbi:hypothetical protein M422DRAFT_177900, partial [Sphaerobolus stellatus SS14]